MRSNSHFSFIDEDLKNKISSILNPKIIPEQFKKGKDYYNDNNKHIDVKYSIPDRFRNNDTLKEILKKAFQTDISPLFTDLNDLKGLPKSKFQAIKLFTYY